MKKSLLLMVAMLLSFLVAMPVFGPQGPSGWGPMMMHYGYGGKLR